MKPEASHGPSRRHLMEGENVPGRYLMDDFTHPAVTRGPERYDKLTPQEAAEFDSFYKWAVGIVGVNPQNAVAEREHMLKDNPVVVRVFHQGSGGQFETVLRQVVLQENKGTTTHVVGDGVYKYVEEGKGRYKLDTVLRGEAAKTYMKQIVGESTALDKLLFP